MKKTMSSKDWIATQRFTSVDQRSRKRAVAIRIGKRGRSVWTQARRATGSVNENVVPRPGSLSTQILPP
jgi:hypothetical protein